MALLISAAWDIRRTGTATIGWTDDSGAHTFSITTGRLSHPNGASLTLYGGTGTYSTGISHFRDVLQAGMDAATAQTVTVTRSALGVYTVACSGATFTITFTGAAGTVMRQLLGFTGNRSGATSYAGQCEPKYQIRPITQARSLYTGVRHMPGGASTHMTDAGRRRGFRPTTMPYAARWEQRFETDARVYRAKADADSVASGHQYTWQALFEDTAAAAEFCFVEESGTPAQDFVGETFGFQLVDPNLDESKLKRVHPAWNKWIVSLDTTPIGYLP